MAKKSNGFRDAMCLALLLLLGIVAVLSIGNPMMERKNNGIQ